MEYWNRRTFLGMLGCLGVVGCGAFLNSARFGALPEGDRLSRIEASPNWRAGEFRNLEPFRIVSSDESVFSIWAKWLFGPKGVRTVPDRPLPAVKTDLRQLDRGRDLAVWLGHSTVYLHLAGMRILIDPVFSEHAAPLPVAVKAFPGTNLWRPREIPDIDWLLVSHDHWDHLDYPTIEALAPRARRIVCPLGVGAHFERFGMAPEKITELDWYGWTDAAGLGVCVTPSRHFSGRLLSRNKTLWGGFALETADRRVLFTGDGGYGRHFGDIARRFRKGFDLVMPDCGQWNRRWAQVHMFPEEAASACEDVAGRILLPVHAGKFCISEHAWDEPFRRIAAAAQSDRPWVPAFPRIGEPVYLDGSRPLPSAHWWEDGGMEQEG